MRVVATLFVLVSSVARGQQQPPSRATAIHGDSGSVAVWCEGDSTWVYIVGPRGNVAIRADLASLPRLADSAARVVGISPDNTTALRNPAPLHPIFAPADFEYQVEQQAHDIPNGPRVQYPDGLRADRVSGQVIARFVVDSTGRPIVGSFKAIKSPNRLFTLAIFSALPDLRFEPAQLKGRPVAELVQIPFAFGPHTPSVKVGGRDGSVTMSFRRDTAWLVLETTRGTFAVHTDSFTMATWADSAAHARAPAAHGAKRLDYSFIKISYPEPSLSAIVAMGFAKLTADAAPTYQISGANGSWEGALALPFDSAQRLFTAMHGAASPMTVEQGPLRDASKPSMSLLAEQQARPRAGHAPAYPESLRQSRIEGSVLFQFTVDSTGRVELPTARVIRSSHPLLALAVYQRLPEMRFDPARLNGRPVKEMVMQPYAFSLDPR